MAITVKIDKSSCQSSGNCIDAAAEAFGWDGDSLAEVSPPASALSRERLIEIAQRCPAMAITLFDESGREIDSGR